MQDTLSSLNILKSTLTGTMTTGQNSRNKCANSLNTQKHHQHQSSDKSSQSKNDEGKLLSLKCSLTNGTSINSTKSSSISSTSSSWQSPVFIDPPKKPTPHFIVNILGLTKENDRNGQSSSSSIPVTNNKASAVPTSIPSIVTAASSSLPLLTSSSSASISESSASTNEKFIDHQKSSAESKPAKKFCKTKSSSPKAMSKTKQQSDNLAPTTKVQSNSGAKTNKKHSKSNLNIQQPLNLSFSSNLMPNSSSPVPPRLSSYSGKSRKQNKTTKNTDEVSKKSRPSSITREGDTSLDKYQSSALDLSKNCRGAKRKKESKASPLTTISSNLTQSSSSSGRVPLSLFASLHKDCGDLVKSSTSPPITAINTLSSCSSSANSSLITAIKEKVSKNDVSANAHIIARSASVSTMSNMSNDSCSSRLSDPSLDNGLTIVETSSVDGGPNSPSDRNRKKKARTTFTGRQIFELEKQLEIKKYLSSSERSEMARLLNVTETQVKIWFQNRRTKWKKQDGITNAQAAEHRVSGTEKTSSTGRKSKSHKNQSSTSSSVSSTNCDNTTGNENLPETEQNLTMNASISLTKSGHNLNLYASDTCEDGDLGMNNDSNSDSMPLLRHNPYSPIFSEEENSSKGFRISKADSMDGEPYPSSAKAPTSEGLSDSHIDFSNHPNEPDSDSSPAPLRIAEKEENDEDPIDDRLNGFAKNIEAESTDKKSYCKDENTDSNNGNTKDDSDVKRESKSSEKRENDLKIGVNELIKCN